MWTFGWKKHQHVWNNDCTGQCQIIKDDRRNILYTVEDKFWRDSFMAIDNMNSSKYNYYSKGFEWRRTKYLFTRIIVQKALSVRGMGALEQSPESKCRTCRLHKTGRPIIARICSSIENNKIWWRGENIWIFLFPKNLKIFWNFSDANAAASRIMLPVKSQINSKLCKYKEEKFLLLSYGNATKKKMAMESGWHGRWP